MLIVHHSLFTVYCSTTSEENCTKLKSLYNICIELLLLLLNWNLSQSNVKVLCRFMSFSLKCATLFEINRSQFGTMYAITHQYLKAKTKKSENVVKTR